MITMESILFVNFVNSEWFDGHGRLDDRLLKPGWYTTFKRTWHRSRQGSRSRGEIGSHPYFEPQHGPLEKKSPNPLPDGARAALFERLLDLRELLRRIIDVVVEGEQVATRDMRFLNTFLERADVRHRLRKVPGGIALDRISLVEDDDERLVGEIALSAAQFLAAGDLQRLKICGNSGCRWVFYDNTNNRSRVWCDTNSCGNLFRVRRYRSRHG
jgi:predicted RNA-binding Zn ribbon-like protein